MSSFRNVSMGEWQVAVAGIETYVATRILGQGRVRVTPWPFNVARLDGILPGFREAVYPQQPVPLTVPFHSFPKDFQDE